MSQWQPQQYDPAQHQQRLSQPQPPYPPQAPASPGPAAPQQPQPASRWPARRLRRWSVTGVIIALTGIIGLNTDLFAGMDSGSWDLSESHSFCNSALGALTQTSYQTVTASCSTVGRWYDFALLLLWGGVAMAVFPVLTAFWRGYQPRA